jgi:cobalamin biosynthesis protein CobD/CbiB
MTTEQFHIRQSHKIEYLAFIVLIAVAIIVLGMSLHWLLEAPVHFLLYFPVYMSAYIASIIYANKYAIDPIGWRSEIGVLLILIAVCVVCMLIVYVAHDEVGSIYITAFFQVIFAYIAFSSAQWHINKRDKKRLKQKLKNEMKGR